MTQAVQALRSSLVGRALFGPSELRAGWRLLIFLAIVIAFRESCNFAFGRLLHGLDRSTLFLVREATRFLVFLFATWIMGRIEARASARPAAMPTAVTASPWRTTMRSTS
jgi:hypothetical protein